MRKNRLDLRGQILYNIVAAVISALIIIPFILLLSVSLSNENDIADFGYRFLPKKIDISAYTYVFANGHDLLQAYKITAVISVITMVGSVFLMSLIAYPLTKREMRGRQFISFYLYFTMLFSGGLVPSYILITQYLHLGDTIWVYILPALISPWYVFMMRTFFQSIPESMLESASIDGASEYRIFFTMVLPLSKPVLSAVALFTFLNMWNNWYTSMLYINKENLISLQYLLQRILLNLKLIQENTNANSTLIIDEIDVPAETVRMAMAICVAGPALFIFPFFQKYFVQGLTVGSVKG